MRLMSGNVQFVLFVSYVLSGTLSKTISGRKPHSCRRMEIVPRKEWKARPPWRNWTMKTPVNDIIIHHTATSECHTKPQCLRDINFIQEYHVDYLAWEDIGYNFLVGGDGNVYEGKGWTSPGAHSINFNTRSIGVAFMGDYRNVTPRPEMLDAALKLISCGVEKGYLTPTREIHGGRDVSCSESPGQKLYDIIRTWDNYKGGRMPLYNC